MKTCNIWELQWVKLMVCGLNNSLLDMYCQVTVVFIVHLSCIAGHRWEMVAEEWKKFGQVQHPIYVQLFRRGGQWKQLLLDNTHPTVNYWASLTHYNSEDIVGFIIFHSFLHIDKNKGRWSDHNMSVLIQDMIRTTAPWLVLQWSVSDKARHM